MRSRGLKNFVLCDESSLDEAFAAARSETGPRGASQQLDAFHKTFNFCMSCRQYTCGNCWNEAEGAACRARRSPCLRSRTTSTTCRELRDAALIGERGTGQRRAGHRGHRRRLAGRPQRRERVEAPP